MFQDDCSVVVGRNWAGLFRGKRSTLRLSGDRARRLQTKTPPGREPRRRSEVPKFETYFFFLALVLPPALATFAFFFFAAMVSTSPDIGMLIASAAIL
ncbi:MAG: hypothetical protein ACT4OF_11010 [Caulobacteraceae bacterium]